MTSVSALSVSIAMAMAAGLVGCFAVMRRMSLAADAMAHVALPGIGVALAFHVHPILGGMAMLLAGTLLIWSLERRTHISTETIIGVVFSAALAVGSMLATGDELIEALLGTPGTLDTPEIAVGLVGAAAVIAFILFRLFDITKPFPIRRIEHLPGGGDDVGRAAHAERHGVEGLELAVSLGQLQIGIGRLRRELGMSVLFVSHDLGMVASICDRVAVMYRGKIVETAVSAELFKHPGHPYTKVLIDSSLSFQIHRNGSDAEE